jgi:uncharacterized Fe-S cluster-containing radical SAM superfamily protein
MMEALGVIKLGSRDEKAADDSTTTAKPTMIDTMINGKGVKISGPEMIITQEEIRESMAIIKGINEILSEMNTILDSSGNKRLITDMMITVTVKAPNKDQTTNETIMGITIKEMKVKDISTIHRS